MKLRSIITAVGATFFLAVPPVSRADVLIVKKDGTVQWATSARKDKKTDELVFVPRMGQAQELRISFTELEQIIPRVVRGKQYSPEQVEKVLSIIRKTVAKHGRLRKRLDPLKDEWEALDKSDPETETRVIEELARFKRSAKRLADYRKAVNSIELYQYRDMQGKFGAVIKKVLVEVKRDYVAVSMQALEKMTAAEPTLENYALLRIYVRELLSAKPDKDIMTTARALQRKTRGRIIHATITRVRNSLKQRPPTIGRYLQLSGDLRDTKRAVADSAKGVAKIDAVYKGLRAAAKKAHPDTAFNFKGYPLSQNDLKQFETMKNLSSVLKISTMQIDERCLIIPAAKPPVFKSGRPFVLKLDLIFNRTPPTIGDLALTFMVMEKKGPVTTMQIPVHPKFRDGRARVRIDDDFLTLPRNFIPVIDEATGGATVYMYLAWRESLPDNTDEDLRNARAAPWTAYSLSCPLPLGWTPRPVKWK